MKRPVVLLLLVGAVGTAHGQTLTSDRNTVLASGGVHVDFPGLSGSVHNDLNLSDGNRISFSRPLTRLDVPFDWSVWRPGSAPKLLEEPQGRPVVLTFDAPVDTFGFEMMSVWLAGREMKMEVLQGGSGELTQFVSSSTGALFFGFTGGSVTQLSISRLPIDDVGSYALGNMLYAPVPEPATCAVLGLCVLALVRRRRGRRSKQLCRS